MIKALHEWGFLYIPPRATIMITAICVMKDYKFSYLTS